YLYSLSLPSAPTLSLLRSSGERGAGGRPDPSRSGDDPRRRPPDLMLLFTGRGLMRTRRRRGVSARRRTSWSAPGAGTPSWRTGCGSWPLRARSHEAIATGLRATLEQLLQHPPCAAALGGSGGADNGDDEAEDAQSCCFETRSSSGICAVVQVLRQRRCVRAVPPVLAPLPVPRVRARRRRTPRSTSCCPEHRRSTER
ncbi:unnamed protein product, partial [Urochloa humidicola]